MKWCVNTTERPPAVSISAGSKKSWYFLFSSSQSFSEKVKCLSIYLGILRKSVANHILSSVLSLSTYATCYVCIQKYQWWQQDVTDCHQPNYCKILLMWTAFIKWFSKKFNSTYIQSSPHRDMYVGIWVWMNK